MKTLSLLLFLTSVFIFPSMLLAQGAFFQPSAANTTAGNQVITIPGAQITVCGFPAVGATATTPCTNKSSLFTSQTLGVSTANPFNADQQGNFSWWAAPAGYTYSICTTASVVQCVNYNAPVTMGQDASGNAVVVAGSFATVSVIGDACANIDALVAAGKTDLTLPPGRFTVNTQCLPLSTVWIHGAGQYLTTLVAGVSLGAKQVIQVLGTSGNHIKNVHISNLGIENGTAGATPTAGMDGIRADYVDHLEIDHTAINQIQGNYGIIFKNSTDVRVHDNLLTNIGNEGIDVMCGGDHIWVERNTIDTITHTDPTPGSYGISSGGEAIPDTCAAFDTNVWILNNEIRNIPVWQGINSHGGDNWTISGNHVSNVRNCINVALDTRGFVTTATQNNQHITGNTCVQGTGDADYAGILVQGALAQVNTGSHDKGVWIENNKTIGFGPTTSSLSGAYSIQFAENVHLVGNEADQYQQNAYWLDENVWEGEATDNKAYDMSGAFTPSISAMFGGNVGGVYGIKLTNNRLKPSTLAVSPQNFMRVSGTGRNYAFTIDPGNYSRFAVTMFNGGSLPVNASTVPVPSAIGATGKNGDVIYDTLGRPAYRFNVGNGYFSFLNSVITTCNTTSGSTVLSACTGGLATTIPWYWFPLGMNITVNGQNVKVISNDEAGNLTVDTNIGATLTGTNVTYQTATASSASTVIDFEQISSGSAGQGKQYRFGDTAALQSATGTRFSSGGPYFSHNAVQTAVSTDNWHQTSAASSFGLFMDATGLHWKLTGSGTADGNFATFWGADRFSIDTNSNVVTIGTSQALKSLTSGNCSSSASPAVCSNFSAGTSTVAAGATTEVINTTQVTANSEIQLTFDSSLGTKLGVTCNTTFGSIWVSARTAATSFTVTIAAAPAANPACFSWSITN